LSGLTLLIFALPLAFNAIVISSMCGATPNFHEGRFTARGFVAASWLNVFLVIFVFQKWADAALKSSIEEQVGLCLLGLVWTMASILMPNLFGISARDDAIERRNPAARLVLLSSILANGLIYAGGNIGGGPSISNNIFSAALGAILFFSIWFGLEFFGQISVSISEERDFASGIRIAGFFMAIALILARAVAGDWHSVSLTIRDFFHDAWFAFGLFAIAIPVERFARPSAQNPFPNRVSHGLLPAALYVVASVWWLARLGPWEGYAR